MGKSFCIVDHRWCKFCRHINCTYTGERVSLKSVHTCPKRAEFRTVSLNELMHRVDIDKTLDVLFSNWTGEKKNEAGYRQVFDRLLVIKPTKTNTYIHGKIETYDDGKCVDIYGLSMNRRDNRSYALGFVPWSEWLSMNIDQETLESLTDEEIVAGCLYELTYYGFNERRIDEHRQKLIDLCPKD